MPTNGKYKCTQADLIFDAKCKIQVCLSKCGKVRQKAGKDVIFSSEALQTLKVKIVEFESIFKQEKTGKLKREIANRVIKIFNKFNLRVFYLTNLLFLNK